MLSVVEAESNINLGNRSGLVIVESDKREDLTGLDASRLVIEYANSKSLLGAAIRSTGACYTVKPDGKPMDNPTAPFPKGGRFRIDFQVGTTI